MVQLHQQTQLLCLYYYLLYQIKVGIKHLFGRIRLGMKTLVKNRLNEGGCDFVNIYLECVYILS